MKRPKASMRAAIQTTADVDHILTTPIGRLRLTAGPAGLKRVEILDNDAADPAHMRGPVHQQKPATNPFLRSAVRALRSYFAGKGLSDDVPLDASALPPFRRKVLTTLASTVKMGTVVTYGELARRAGRPHAARAVGSAMANNPLPLFLPCHRVVAGSGLGGFGAGLATKRALLAHEAVAES